MQHLWHRAAFVLSAHLNKCSPNKIFSEVPTAPVFMPFCLNCCYEGKFDFCLLIITKQYTVYLDCFFCSSYIALNTPAVSVGLNIEYVAT